MNSGAWLLLLVLATGCTGEAPKTVPTNEPAAPSPAPSSCRQDQDCTDGWMPTNPGCGSTKRCFGGQCLIPPAMSGVSASGTTEVILETLPRETTIRVEVADERFEITRGLMCRGHMASGWGMLFLMERARQQSFWMKNTLIPLDIIFIDEQWKVLGVAANAAPQTTSSRAVPGVSKYVLELNAGAAAEAGIRAGTTVRYFPPTRP